MDIKLELETWNHRIPPKNVFVVLYFSYFSFFFGRRAPRSFILSFMLNLLLRSTIKEHFREKNQLMSDVISTLIHKYYLLKLIVRHKIINTWENIYFYSSILFLTFPSKYIANIIVSYFCYGCPFWSCPSRPRCLAPRWPPRPRAPAWSPRASGLSPSPGGSGNTRRLSLWVLCPPE